MINKQCTQTFWVDGRLTPVIVHRPSGLGRWPLGKPYPKNQFVARVVGKAGNLEIVQGPLASPERVADSVLIHMGKEPSSIDRHLWRSLPSGLIRQVCDQIRDASKQIQQQHSQYSNEEAITGALFSRSTALVHGTNDWKAELKFVEFSKQSKEGETGADLALIIDVLSQDGRRAFKTLWFQAKVAAHRRVDLDRLPRLPEQMKKMAEHTKSGFGLLYTPDATIVVGPNLPPDGITIESAIIEALNCRIGDQSSSFYAKSIDRLETYRLLLTERP